METRIPEKASVLERLKQGRFNVPDFIFVPAVDFQKENFGALKAFLDRHRENYKVIARSAHPQEEFFKGGTFESLETYSDLAGIQYARKRMIHFSQTAGRLSILRQQKFHHAPDIDLNEMGVIVMPFVSGTSVMAKRVGHDWEFGYSGDRSQKLQSEPFITKTPHDRRLLEISSDIERCLGYRCEIEFVVSQDGEIYVVQAKDISKVETLEMKESERSVQLDGVRRLRKRRNYRERPVYVMDNASFYLTVISKCEELVLGAEGPRPSVEEILKIVQGYESELETFAMNNIRFAVLGLSIKVPEDLYQIANHYLDELPDAQKKLSRALYDNLYRTDYFLAEADTLIAKDKVRVHIRTHEAYGIDTVRNPIWNVYWDIENHDEKVKEFKRIGFKTGDTVGIEIDAHEKPTVYRL